MARRAKASRSRRQSPGATRCPHPSTPLQGLCASPAPRLPASRAWAGLVPADCPEVLPHLAACARPPAPRAGQRGASRAGAPGTPSAPMLLRRDSRKPWQKLAIAAHVTSHRHRHVSPSRARGSGGRRGCHVAAEHARSARRRSHEGQQPRRGERAMAEQAALKNSIHMKLTESGEYDRCDAPARCRARRRMRSAAPVCRMKEQLRQRLIDSGWRDQLKEYTMGAPPPRVSTLPHCPPLTPSLPPPPPSNARARDACARRPHPQQGRRTPYGRAADEGDHASGTRCAAAPPAAPAQPAILRAASRACMLVMASATVPDDIKMELLANIRKFVEEQA